MHLSKIMDLAISQAKKSKGIGSNRNYRLGSVLFDKKRRVLAVENNSYKTHPLVMEFSEFPTLHAEMSCLIHNGLDNSKGCDIMVVRIRKDNSLGLAKPCKSCEKALRFSGINRVYYTTNDGSLQWQNINQET